MSLDTHPVDVIGNPVRRTTLLRMLRSTTNVVLLVVWTSLIVALGIVVLVHSTGTGGPLHPGLNYHDFFGATLAQWWIVGLVVGLSLMAIASTVLTCGANDEARRIASWSQTLLSPGQVARGIWSAQAAFLLLCLVAALPVAAIALASGGTSVTQLVVGAAGAFVTAITMSALALAVSCRARRLWRPMIIMMVAWAVLLAGPLAAHQTFENQTPPGDPILLLSPLTGVADAAAPLAHPAIRFGAAIPCFEPCVEPGPTNFDTKNPAVAPLDNLRAGAQWPNAAIPTWAWTAGGSLFVLVLSLSIARFRIARPLRVT